MHVQEALDVRSHAHRVLAEERRGARLTYVIDQQAARRRRGIEDAASRLHVEHRRRRVDPSDPLARGHIEQLDRAAEVGREHDPVLRPDVGVRAARVVRLVLPEQGHVVAARGFIALPDRRQHRLHPALAERRRFVERDRHLARLEVYGCGEHSTAPAERDPALDFAGPALKLRLRDHAQFELPRIDERIGAHGHPRRGPRNPGVRHLAGPEERGPTRRRVGLDGRDRRRRWLGGWRWRGAGRRRWRRRRSSRGGLGCRGRGRSERRRCSARLAGTRREHERQHDQRREVCGASVHRSIVRRDGRALRSGLPDGGSLGSRQCAALRRGGAKHGNRAQSAPQFNDSVSGSDWSVVTHAGSRSARQEQWTQRLRALPWNDELR